MRFTLFFLLLSTLAAKSQQRLVLAENNEERYLILDLDHHHFAFIYDEESDMEYLVRRENQNLIIIDSFITDAGIWGWVDFDESFSRNDTIYIKAYKHMSALNGYFIYALKEEKLINVGYEFENPNDGSVAYADSMLEAGNISECIRILHGIQYPHSEYDTWGYGIDIMEKAHSLALEQYQIKNYDSAATIMSAAFEYWENGSMLGFANKNDFEETRDDGFNIWEDEQMKLWIGDYGLFLCLAKNYEKSIEINLYLNMIYPETAGPYLQLGDSYFDLGKITEAKAAYKKYSDLKTDSGRGREIPQRVKDRLK